MAKFIFLLLVISFLFVFCNQTEILSASSFDSVVDGRTISLVNFYVNWCVYCRFLSPIIDEVADEIKKLDHDILVAKIDCVEHLTVTSRFSIKKFPTLKVFKNGKPTNVEYVGERSVKAILKFISEIYYTGPRNITESEFKELKRPSFSLNIDSSSHRFYDIYSKLGDEYSLECGFYRTIGEPIKENPVIKFTGYNVQSEVYNGNLFGDEFSLWVLQRCRPYVKEITFSNAEQITSSAKALLIFFYLPGDLNSIEAFKKLMESHKSELLDIATPVTANAKVFDHALSHIGKTPRDAPVVVFDDFNHMYPLPTLQELDDDAVFSKYVDNFKSGKLHQEFHENDRSNLFYIKFEEKAADPGSQRLEIAKKEIVESDKKDSDNNNDDQVDNKRGSGIIGSIFKKLAPNNKRYTMLNYDDL